MKNNLPVIFSILPAFFFAGPAFAHVGHIGELAGHSHIIALGAGVAAAALAGLIIRSKRGEKSEETVSDEEIVEDADDAAETA